MVKYYVAIKNEKLYVHTPTKSNHLLPVKKQNAKYKTMVSCFARCIYLSLFLKPTFSSEFPGRFVKIDF